MQSGRPPPTHFAARIELLASLSHIIVTMPREYGVDSQIIDFTTEPAYVIAKAVLASETGKAVKHPVRSIESLYATLAALRQALPDTFIDLRTGENRWIDELWAVGKADRILEKYAPHHHKETAA